VAATAAAAAANRKWCGEGSVLYADVDGRDSDCFEPFFRLPTMDKLDPETGSDSTAMTTQGLAQLTGYIMRPLITTISLL
jgi:hypothetical protein